jgi:hypothetical protein
MKKTFRYVTKILLLCMVFLTTYKNGNYKKHYCT